MINIYSLSFFRHANSNYEHPNCGTSQGRFFANFLPTLLRAFYANYPEWELRIHHDENLALFPYGKVVFKLAEWGKLKVVDMGKAERLCESMMWRLKPLWDPDANIVVCRDVDSLPMPREKIMIDQFIQRGLAVNALLDSESHCGPLMGGMVAYKAPEFRKLFTQYPTFEAFIDASRIPQFANLNQHGSDQSAQNGLLWKTLQKRALIHQRRNIVQYPDAAETWPAAPQKEPADFIVAHIGAGYDLVKAMNIYDPLPSSEIVRKAEAECV
jgi:hypothetical protein